MPQARELIDEIRRDLRPVEERLFQHPYIQAVETGRLPRERLALFAGEQYSVIASDLRSVGLLVNRFGASPSGDFFLNVLQGERTALGHLQTFARALGLDQTDLEGYEPLPGAHAYTCYMAWLGLYASDAEVAAAYLVNFPAWGESCGRLSRALQARYRFSSADVAFFDFFATPAPEFEPSALAVIQYGLDLGADPRLIHRAARLLQGFELLYWDTLHEASQG